MDDDLERYTAAAKRKGLGEVTCPVCGHGKWFLNPGNFVMPKGDGLRVDLDDASAVEVIGNVCGNCGWIRLHVSSVLFDEDAE